MNDSHGVMWIIAPAHAWFEFRGGAPWRPFTAGGTTTITVTAMNGSNELILTTNAGTVQFSSSATGDPDGPLFRTAVGKTGSLIGNAMWQQDAYRMIQRHAGAADIKTRIGDHTSRAYAGITAYLKNSGKLEIAQHIANHESPRTTKLYDRRRDEISLDEVERIAI
jgi:integrase